AGALYKEEGRVAEKIIDTIFSFGKPGAFVMHLNMPILLARSSNMLSNLMQAALRVQSRYSGKGHFVIVLRSDGGAEFDIEKRKQEYRAQALSAGIAVYDELRNAAVGLSALHRYESFQYARQHISPVSS
ncbi:MAG: hypothetical protein WD005_00110, partial [Haliea sp.]